MLLRSLLLRWGLLLSGLPWSTGLLVAGLALRTLLTLWTRTLLLLLLLLLWLRRLLLLLLRRDIRWLS